MNEWPSFLVERQTQIFALQVAIGGLLVSTVALLAGRLLRRRSAPLRYGILFAGVVGLLAAPAFVGVGQRLQGTLLEAEAPTEETVRISVERLAEFLAFPPPEAPPAEAASSWSEAVGPTLVSAWALGIVIGLGRLMRGMGIQRRALLGAPWRAAWWTIERQTQLAKAVGLRKFPEVVLSPAAPMPLVLGLFRPTIVLPEQAPASWGQAQWEAVLLHEAAHVARRDPWSALVQQLGVILFWWCPLVHVLARRLNHLREQICDDYALQGACDGIAYAEVLIESAECLVRLQAVPVPIGLLDSARGGLEDRITRLLQKEREPMTKLSLSGKLLGAACLVAACLLITAATAFSGGTPPAPKKIQIKIIVDGKEIDLSDIQIQGVAEANPKAPQPEKAPRGAIAPIAVAVQVKPDPRIEELVRQAEAIKPGSGDEVRRALQGKGAGEGNFMLQDVFQSVRVPAGPPVPVPVIPAGDKKIIILSIENGKVIQLHDLKVLIEKGAVNDFNPRPGAGGPATKPMTPGQPPAKVGPGLPLSDPTRKAPTPANADNNEALLRQLERINAEVQELRKRLDESKHRQAK
jgi:beta-lactamase regulating signal transducer with metallopeptidase domain